MTKVSLLLIMSALSGLCYWAGGKGKPFFASWMRDWLIPPIAILTMFFLGLYDSLGSQYTVEGIAEFHRLQIVLKIGLSIGLTIILTGLALSTYRYFLPKPKDYKWFHYALHGFFVGLATIPCMFLGIHLYAVIIRAVVLSIAMGVWSHFIGRVFVEDTGRGALIILTLPVLVL